MSNCSHVAKVIDWKLDENFNYAPSKYGCTRCDEKFDEAPRSQFAESHSHSEYVEGCFGCKIQTLQLHPGDAASAVVANGWTQKKWDRELDLYASARKQGIQPDGTSTAKVQHALDMSEKTGVAYGS